MPKKLDYKHAELRRAFRYFFWKRTTPDNYTIAREHAYLIQKYNARMDIWEDVTVFAIKENADKFINTVCLNIDVIGPDPSLLFLREYARSLFKDA